MKSNSWVIVKKDTQEAIIETWNESILKYLKPEFEAIESHEYLCKFNRRVKKNLGVGTEKEKYLKVLREIETHIRATPEPLSYIVNTLLEVLPEHQIMDKSEV